MHLENGRGGRDGKNTNGRGTVGEKTVGEERLEATGGMAVKRSYFTPRKQFTRRQQF